MADEKKRLKVFVISPIGAGDSDTRIRSDKIFEFVVRAAFPESEYQVNRSDKETSPDKITSLIVRRIKEADLVVADITDHNPNVFYELAIAHGYKRPTVHIGHVDTSVPFDIADMRIIKYDESDLYSVRDCLNKVKAAAETALADPDDLKPRLHHLIHLRQFMIKRLREVQMKQSPRRYR